MKFSDVKGNSEIIKFRTHFVRSEYFCFEWQDYGPNRGKSESFSSIWSDPKTTYFCWHRRSLVVQEEENLQMAICGATGCSAGGAHIVPELLLEEIRTDSKHLLLVRPGTHRGRRTRKRGMLCSARVAFHAKRPHFLDI